MDPQIAQILSSYPEFTAVSMKILQCMQGADQAAAMAAMQSGDAQAIAAALGSTPEELAKLTEEFRAVTEKIMSEHPELATQLSSMQIPGMPPFSPDAPTT
jgi:hypothetical protein